MTLREGLDEYFAANPGLTQVEPDAPEAELFLPHDVCHVVFGLGTSLVEEAMTDVWTMFGADVGIRNYGKLMRHVSAIGPLQIARQIGFATLAWQLLLAIGPTTRAWWRARKMRERWQWHAWRQHLDTPLGELRQHFGIAVFVPKASVRQISTVAAAVGATATARPPSS